jgi:hypothetical protein
VASVTACSIGACCCDGTLTAACAGAGDELLSDSYDLTEIEDGFFFAVRCLPCSRCLQLGLSASFCPGGIHQYVTGARAAMQVEGKVRFAIDRAHSAHSAAVVLQCAADLHR